MLLLQNTKCFSNVFRYKMQIKEKEIQNKRKCKLQMYYVCRPMYVYNTKYPKSFLNRYLNYV